MIVILVLPFPPLLMPFIMTNHVAHLTWPADEGTSSGRGQVSFRLVGRQRHLVWLTCRVSHWWRGPGHGQLGLMPVSRVRYICLFLMSQSPINTKNLCVTKHTQCYGQCTDVHRTHCTQRLYTCNALMYTQHTVHKHTACLYTSEHCVHRDCIHAMHWCTPNTLYTNTLHARIQVNTVYTETAYMQCTDVHPTHCTQTHCMPVYKWTLCTQRLHTCNALMYTQHTVHKHTACPYTSEHCITHSYTFQHHTHEIYIDYRPPHLYPIYLILWARILYSVYIIYHTVIYYILCTINWSYIHIYLYMNICIICIMILVDSCGWYGSLDPYFPSTHSNGKHGTISICGNPYGRLDPYPPIHSFQW